jgi:hypothetical protein
MARGLWTIMGVEENEHDEPKISVMRNQVIRKRCGIDR